MSAIGPGDWVEFVGPGSPRRPEVEVGSLHRVRRFVFAYGACPACASEATEGFTPCGEREVPCGYTVFSWCPCRWRPVYRPDETLATRLMEPLPDALAPTLPERVSEPATAR